MTLNADSTTWSACTITACDTGYSKCGNACVLLQTDASNCGACGTVCPAGQSCASGTCQAVCTGTMCSGYCTDTNSDVNNCGGCGISCGEGGKVCSSGVCACPTDQTDCSGTCQALLYDPQNCGACGNVCASGTSCKAGACCTPDQINCGGSCVDPTSDMSNCGGCGLTCSTSVSGGVASCDNGSCNISCDTGHSFGWTLVPQNICSYSSWALGNFVCDGTAVGDVVFSGESPSGANLSGYEIYDPVDCTDGSQNTEYYSCGCVAR